jgi:hypothetical protein
VLTNAMRSILILNLAIFAAFFIAKGSPEPRLGDLGPMIDNWWVLSTAVVTVMFAFRLFNKVRGKGPGKLWLDAMLFGAWVCACGVLFISGAAGFIGF